MFVEQGRKGNNNFLLYLLTILICFSGFVSLTMYLMDRVGAKDQDNNQMLFLALLPFSVVVVVVLMNTILLHKRKMSSVFNVIGHFRLKRFMIGFGFWTLLMGLGDWIYSNSLGGEYKFHFSGNTFFYLLFISLSLFPVQTLAEELFFRSYILQGLSNLFKRSFVPIIFSSVFFMLLHSANPENEKFGAALMSGYYVISGIFLALLTVLDDGIEQSYGIHFATNLYGSVLVGYEGSALTTDSLWKIQQPSGIVMTITSVLAMVIYFLFSKYYFKIKNIGVIFQEHQFELAQEINEEI